MAELVECARLEIVYTGDRIEGSNPPISARELKTCRPIFLGGMFLPWAEIGGWVRMSGAYHAPHENSIFVKRDMHDQYADKQLQNMQKRIFFIEFLRLCFVIVYQGTLPIRQ